MGSFNPGHIEQNKTGVNVANLEKGSITSSSSFFIELALKHLFQSHL